MTSEAGTPRCSDLPSLSHHPMPRSHAGRPACPGAVIVLAFGIAIALGIARAIGEFLADPAPGEPWPEE